LNEKKYIRSFQWALAISAALLIVLICTAWILSGPAQEWKRYQAAYKAELELYADSLVDIESFSRMKGIHEFSIEELGRADRCVTCHMGIENSLLEHSKQPFRYHPGDFLKEHPVEKYGCTICHGGQGRALNTKDAHALDIDSNWDHPILSQPYIQSSCGQCHLTIFDENQKFAGTEIFEDGQAIFNREGCLGCHKARGVGGIIGPDLTEQGEKSRYEYSFQNIETEETVSNWLKEHFRDPEMVSPGSQMLKIDLPEEDLDALTTFVLGLARPEISFDYFSIETLKEFKGERNSLESSKAFSMLCSGCHGKEGEGKSYTDFKTGVPGIRMADFQRAVSEEYLEFTLLKGRSQRQMASWMTDISGVRESEIRGLVSFIKGHPDTHSQDFSGERLRSASIDGGASLFQEKCATCHGEKGTGGLALSLARADLMKNATDAYLFHTLEKGRGNTAMPSWSILTDIQIYSLVAYLRSFQKYTPSANILFGEKVDIQQGKLKYHFLCSRCHGESGQGQTGPAIINKQFLEVAPDDFLFNTISSGREHTAMFGWSTDVYNAEKLNRVDIGNIIGYMRSEAEKRPDYIYAGANPGDKDRGKNLFKENCAECHGQNGEGEKAPALNNQELLNAASNGYLLATITIGRAGTAMPLWGYEMEDHPALSGKERQDIVAYIRGWERIRIGF